MCWWWSVKEDPGSNDTSPCTPATVDRHQPVGSD